MNWEEALEHISSPEFDAELNVVSGTAAFFRAVGRQPAVQDSLGFMSLSGERQEEVLNRIADLATLEIDPNYENPNDTSLAVLLWLTCFSSPRCVQIGARYVEQAPQCWYARKLARQITAPHSADSLQSWVPVRWGAEETKRRIFDNGTSSGMQLNTVSPEAKVFFLTDPHGAVDNNKVTGSKRSLGDES